VALVEFTRRAEQSILEILNQTGQRDESLLVVDMGEGDGEAQLSVQPSGEWPRLQRDVDLVGPFRVEVGGAEMALFVREPRAVQPGRYELDYAVSGGAGCFRIRPRTVVTMAG